MGNAATASVTGVQVAPAKSAIRDLPIAKVWAFAVGQFGWALLSGIMLGESVFGIETIVSVVLICAGIFISNMQIKKRCER